MRTLFLFAVLSATSLAFGLDVRPDSSSLTVKLMSSYYRPLDTIVVFNDAAVRIDSVTMRFLDGDSIDMRGGSQCDTANGSCYLYGGWSYGDSLTLRYCRDSLFLLQGQKGDPLRFTLAPGDSLVFFIQAPVNCPVCGRMPSFPKTTRYLFSFVSSEGARAEFLLKLNQNTGVRPAAVNAVRPADGRKLSSVNVQGRTLTQQAASGAVVAGNEVRVRVGRK